MEIRKIKPQSSSQMEGIHQAAVQLGTSLKVEVPVNAEFVERWFSGRTKARQTRSTRG